MRNFFSKTLYFLAVIIVISVAGLFLFRSKIFAGDLGGGDQQMIDLGNGLESKTIRVSQYGNVGKIEIEKSLFSSCATDLTGFQNEAQIRGTIVTGLYEKAIEIVGVAGAHAENRQYFTIDKNYCPKPLAFVKNGVINYNIYSDEPNFLLQDFNVDGRTDLAADYRNYDLNPLIDGTRDIYFYNPVAKQFEFSRTENFQYQEVD